MNKAAVYNSVYKVSGVNLRESHEVPSLLLLCLLAANLVVYLRGPYISIPCDISL